MHWLYLMGGNQPVGAVIAVACRCLQGTSAVICRHPSGRHTMGHGIGTAILPGESFQVMEATREQALEAGCSWLLVAGYFGAVGCITVVELILQKAHNLNSEVWARKEIYCTLYVRKVAAA